MPILDQGFVTNTSTSWVIGATIIVLILWDYLAYKTDKRGDTISEIMLRWSYRSPAIAFAIGVVMGHLFWPQIVHIVK